MVINISVPPTPAAHSNQSGSDFGPCGPAKCPTKCLCVCVRARGRVNVCVGGPKAYVTLLCEMYCGQTAQVRTDQLSKTFRIQRGTKQGDVALILYDHAANCAVAVPVYVCIIYFCCCLLRIHTISQLSSRICMCFTYSTIIFFMKMLYLR